MFCSSDNTLPASIIEYYSKIFSPTVCARFNTGLFYASLHSGILFVRFELRGLLSACLTGFAVAVPCVRDAGHGRTKLNPKTKDTKCAPEKCLAESDCFKCTYTY